MRFLLTLLLFIPIVLCAQDHIIVSGFIREKGSSETLSNVRIHALQSSANQYSNSAGYFTIRVPKADSLHISFIHIAYSPHAITIPANRDTTLQIDLHTYQQLEDVVVLGHSEYPAESQSEQMSKISIPIHQIRNLPSFLGENDALKAIQLMPGVQSGSEGQTGLYVRGGGPDQNLVLLDDALVYNANHLFGFFSIFNTDILKRVELTKGGFPARYGGRLSSVLEMHMKDGHKDQWHAEGSISLIASRLTAEIPLIKKKLSLIVSGRRTYIDVLARPFLSKSTHQDDRDIKPGYYFYDLNTKLSYDVDHKNKIYISSYFGKDKFYVNQLSDTEHTNLGLDWGNKTATIRWSHLFHQKLFSSVALIYSNFNFGVNSSAKDQFQSDETAVPYSLKYDSQIQDWSSKVDFDYFPNNTHTIKFGIHGTFHNFSPSAIAVAGPLLLNPIERADMRQKSFEGGIYVEDTWQIAPRIKANIGLRFSSFQVARKWYLRPEPRISTSFQLANDLSFKFSYADMNQYVHMLSNTGLGLPTDLWVPTTRQVAPQQAKQIAIGLAKDIPHPGVSITLEVYGKNMRNILSYKEGASFLSINERTEMNWEENVTAGKGVSYGSELLIHKKSGKFSGWIGYTLSWIKWKFPALNHGKVFYPRYDRRNDLSVVGIYHLNSKIKISATWVWGTGNNLTIPVASYLGIADYSYTHRNTNYYSQPLWRGSNINEYGEKNSFRAEPYHRLDVSVQFTKQKKKYERIWEFGLYNLYNRKNPFFYDIETNKEADGTRKMALKKYTLFPILPSVSYRFKI